MSSVSIPEKPVKFRSARRKKRRAPCVGRQPTISEPATSSATAEGEVPIPILTASGKLGPSNDGSSSVEATPVIETKFASKALFIRDFCERRIQKEGSFKPPEPLWLRA